MAVIDSGGSTSGQANVDANYNLKVVLPTTASQAGYAQLTSVSDATSGTSRSAKVSDADGLYASEQRALLNLDFNSASTTWSSKIGTNATTMAKAVSQGFMVLNSGNSTTTTQGISIYSWYAINVQDAYSLHVRTQIKTANAAATNKQMDVGLGYYNFAAGQANAMNDFIGFRWTTTGGLQAVLETSQGGAPTSQTTTINGGVPYSDAVSREYEIIVSATDVEYYVDGAWVARITKPAGSWHVLKSRTLPWIARVFNSGAASAAAQLAIGDASVFASGCDDNVPQPFRLAAMNKNSYYWQPDLTTGSTQTHSYPASGTAPTPNIGSNTASAANNTAILGGLIGNTLTGVTVTLSTNILWTAYQNPAVPTAAGVATNASTFMVTKISVSPMIVTAALTGGGFTAVWFAAIGASATSLATTDADGTTAVAQTAPRIVPLPLVSTLAAAAALGTVSTDVGDHQFIFPTPLPVHPGQFISIGMRTIAVTAAVTAGAANCNIEVNGYWE